MMDMVGNKEQIGMNKAKEWLKYKQRTLILST